MEVSLSLRTGSSTAFQLTPPDPIARLVVAHGAGNDRRYSFAPFFEAALTHGFEVLSFDLPGHGRGNTSVFEVERAVDDFAEAVDQALASMTTSPLPWFLLGNSLGGSLALRAVTAGLLAPRGAVAVGMPARLHRDWRMTLGEIPSLFSPAMRSYRAHVGSWREVFPAFGAFRREEFPVRCNRAAYLDAVEAVLNRAWDAPPARDVPILLVQGDRDTVARAPETQQWVAERQRQGLAIALSLVPRVGHLDVMLDRRVHAQVLDWLGGILGR